MNALRRVGVSIFAVLGLVLAPVASQAGAATFSPAPGEYFVDTSTLELTGPGTNITGVNEGGIAVFAFDGVSVPAGVEIFAEGSRPLELRSAGAFTLAGLIEASGFSTETNEEGPIPGGPGGGAGGAQAGSGPGGGGVGSHNENGGGGGGFGGDGAAGGIESVGVGGVGGLAYGNLDAALQGGSGGGGGTVGGPNVGGGGGGGALKLSASALTITPSGEVFADGGDGNGGSHGASGGGSGGGIVLRAGVVDVTGVLSAEGGDGGTGGCCGDGGGGGGGRIAYQYETLANAGTASVGGGVSGVSGPFGHGGLSPDPTGAAGVIGKFQILTPATTSPATAISSGGLEEKCSGLKISKGRVKVKDAKAPIRLSSSAACEGELALFMKSPSKGKAKGQGKGKAKGSVKGKGKGRKSVLIGSASFSLEAGQKKIVKVSLSAAALKRLKLGKALPATVKATTTDSAGAKQTTKANVSLKLAKKGKGPRKRR